LSPKINDEITDVEVRDIVEKLDYWKTKEADGAHNPMYKCGGPEMTGFLVGLFNYLQNCEMIPSNW
jgi:hypothetical protein